MLPIGTDEPSEIVRNSRENNRTLRRNSELFLPRGFLIPDLAISDTKHFDERPPVFMPNTDKATFKNVPPARSER